MSPKFFVPYNYLMFLFLLQLVVEFAKCQHSDELPVSKPPSEPIVLSPMVRSSNHFGFKVINEINPTHQIPMNVLFSPLGLWVALAMIHQGAEGQTAKQLESALDFDPNLDKSQIPQTIRQMMNVNTSGSTFQIINSLLIQDGLQLTETYVKTIQDYFNADIFFTGSPEVCNNINRIIADKTVNGVQETLKAIPAEILMMLLNVVHFKGNWMHPFFENNSRHDTFYGYNDTKYDNVTFMNKLARFGFIYLNDYDADMLELPFQNDSIALYAILPRDVNDDLSEIRSGLNVLYIESMINKISYRHESTVIFPRLKLNMEYDQISEILRKLGITDAFSSTDAKFGPMSTKVPLHLNQLVHRINMNLDESGAISTSDLENALSAIAKPLMFEFNHPFFYFLRSKQTGQIFLLGEIHKF